jgi:aldehyde dehydrogenase (NAD+)
MVDLIREPHLYIGGEWVPGGGSYSEVGDPATEEVTGVVTQASPADVDAAVAAARAAFPRWAATGVDERVALVRRLHDVIEQRAEVFAGLITREQGSPPRVARKLHVDLPVEVIARTADALAQFPFRSTIGTSTILREPIGVVAAITPWNLPLHQVVVKVVPALAAGVTVVLKPAALTPLAAFELARAIESAGFPAGTFNLVTGDGRTVGDQLTRHPEVDHVSFTGSTPVGRQVAVAAAGTLKRVTLELGGKSASVVLSTTDDDLLATAVKVTVANCYLNGGQTCTALSRLIVPADRIERVEELAVAAAATYEPGIRLGPLISASQRKEVSGFLEPDATAGAKLVAGGPGSSGLPRRGYYVRPTVFSRVSPQARIAREEIFGPVLSILPATCDDDAVELANDSIYGLGGAVWSSSKDAALDAAARIRTGQVDVNGAPFNPRAPFGGYKQSGIGREIGDYGIDDVLEVKAVQQ